MIHICGASFVYQAPDGEVEALRRVDMDVASGEFCSVVGPSGCGKSTLLSVISGLERLTAGTVEVDGAPVCGPSEKIGFMPQRDQLFPWRTIRDNVTLGLSVAGRRTPEALAYADALLQRYGLWEFAQKRPDQLSGGMRQRCALIRTMATNPKILLLDEPFSALDFQTRLSVSSDISRIIRQEGTGDPRHLRGHQPLRPHFCSQRPSRRGEKRPHPHRPARSFASGAAGHRGVPHLFSGHLEGAGSS